MSDIGVDDRRAQDAEVLRRAADVIAKQSISMEPIAGATIDPRRPWEKWPRKVQQFQGTIPVRDDGKQKVQFVITQPCDVKLENGKICGEKLIARRIENYRFKKDKLANDPNADIAQVLTTGKDGSGGMLEYNPTDYRYYIYCNIHGPFPAGPLRWDKDGKPV